MRRHGAARQGKGRARTNFAGQRLGNAPLGKATAWQGCAKTSNGRDQLSEQINDKQSKAKALQRIALFSVEKAVPNCSER
jgi:hypothetical protein